jgi:hypothetical protein
VPVAGIKGPLFGSAASSQALQNLMTQPRSHLFESRYARVSSKSIDANDQLSAALAGANVATVFRQATAWATS